MTSQAFSNVTSGIQSVVITVAVVIGGIWALYRFSTLKEIARAKAELQEIQKRLFERGILDIQVQENEIGHMGESIHYVKMDVTIHNTGNRTEVINWSKSGAYATSVGAKADGDLEFAETIASRYVTPESEVPASSILPGQTRQLSFLFALRSRGIYHLMFRATVSSPEAAIHAQEYRTAGLEAEECVWQSCTYFCVQ
jgi:hypothetical protein